MSVATKDAQVESEVQALLARSTAFQALPEESRQRLFADMSKVSGYLADKGWLAEPTPARARALEDKKAPPSAVDQLKQRLAGPQDPAGKGFTAGAVREGTQQFGELVQKVDFPKFVSGLVQGVFQAVVDASIQQMQAFGELLAATAKTVDQFAKDHISDAQARDHVANRYPSAVQVDTSGEGPARLRPRGEDGGIDVGAEFGVPGADLSDDDAEQQLVDSAKMEMAKSRQQLMATMVLLGINRIVVTNGHINAKVLFDMRASDEARRHSQAALHDEAHSSSASFAMAAGAFGPFGGMAGGFSSTDHTTTVSSSVDDASESKAAVKAQLSGDVRLAFKSETFPLEKMVDVMGLQNLSDKAAPTPSPARQRQAAPPPAALPPSPAVIPPPASPAQASAPGGAK
jgi:hypothetical protein